MSTVGGIPDSSEAGFPKWIAGLCRRFSEASGWTVRFVADAIASDASRVTAREEKVGLRGLGKVQLLVPHDAGSEHRLRARATTELLVELIEELAATRQAVSKRTDQLMTMVDLGRVVGTETDTLAAVDRIIKAGVELTDFEGLAFFLVDAQRDSLRLRCGYHPHIEGIPFPSRSIEGASPDMVALTRGQVILDGHDDPTSGQWMPAGTSRAVCTSVETPRGPIGTLWAFGAAGQNDVKRDLRVLQALALQVATTLEGAALDGVQENEDRRVAELERIAKTQSGEQLGVLPSDAGFDAVGRCHSRDELGGDLCELVAMGNYRTLVAVGDACGHGVQAAFVMTAVRSALRAVMQECTEKPLETDEIVSRINRTLCLVTAEHQFMSCLVGILDTQEMTFSYTNAGHPVPMLFRNRGAEALESHGMPLGVLAEAEYRGTRMSLRGNDLLMLFSDGLVEAMNEQQELFRTEGVIEAVGELTGESRVEDVMSRVWDACDRHGGGAFQDDRTLLLLRMEKSQQPAGPHRRQSTAASRSTSSERAINSR